jgi:hypothetical protein
MTEQVMYDEYGIKIVNNSESIVFKCPKCGEGVIARSSKARALAKEYKCPKCGFVGP